MSFETKENFFDQREEAKPYEKTGEKPLNKEQKRENRKAKRLLNGEKMRLILQDESCKEALYASLRTLANLGVSVADIFPGLGELPSWAADAVKILKLSRAKNIERKARKNNDSSGKEKELSNFWAKIDISPDVPVWIAVGTEVIDAAVGTSLPSHAVETTIQGAHDLPRIKAGLNRIKEIWGAETVEELKLLADQELQDYNENREEIDEAIATFSK